MLLLFGGIFCWSENNVSEPVFDQLLLAAGCWVKFFFQVHGWVDIFGQEHVNKPRWTLVIFWRFVSRITSPFVFCFFSASVRNCGSEGRSSSRDVITVMPLHQISPRGRVRSHPFELANVGWIFHFPPLLTEASWTHMQGLVGVTEGWRESHL